MRCDLAAAPLARHVTCRTVCIRMRRPKQDATARPQNTQLYVRETEDLMDCFGGLGWNPFEEWWTAYLANKQ